jgi:hypothetical protein
MEILEVGTRGQPRLSIAKNSTLGREVEGAGYVTLEGPRNKMHVGSRGTAGNEVQSLRAQVMGTATGKNKVINIQGQQRKVIASWRLTSLERSQLPNDGRLEEVAPWFRFDAKLSALASGWCRRSNRTPRKLAWTAFQDIYLINGHRSYHASETKY